MGQFNIQRFCQLLQTEETLRKSQKSFFHENKNEYLELLSYRIMIRDQYFYQNHSKYLSIIKDFLERKIDTKTFISTFQDIKIRDEKRLNELTLIYDEYRRRLDLIQQQKDLEKLFASSIDYESKRFSDLTGPILDFYWSFYFALDKDPEFEKKYRNLVRENFMDMQNYFNN